MNIEDYFDFLAIDDIRIKGHRIGIEDVLNYYLQGYSVDEILIELPSLTLEKIYATLTYYHHNRPDLDRYLHHLSQKREHHYQQWAAKPSTLIERLRTAKAAKAEETLLIK